MRGLVTAVLVLAARLGTVLHALLLPARQRLYRFDLWLVPWLKRRRALAGGLPPVPGEACRDVLFCFVDHFEPGTQGAHLERSRERFRAWTELYPSLARGFVDSDGRHPQHGFFFPPHYFREEYITGLAEMDWQGLGETELHLHHENDNSENLRATLAETLARYAGYGIFECQGDPVTRRYGFIHGNWALDNSRPKYCGVNDELTILRETGCYADFTFPSLHASQPQLVNELYRAVDDPNAPKSYDSGRLLEPGRAPAEDEFLMIPGPLGLRPRRRFPFFAVEDADVTGGGPGTPERVRNWVREAIHVRGRPEWLFVKVHTHGAPESHRDALLGEGAALMYRTLCEEFGDGKRFRLHFVNAREMANIARAAEDGHGGDAGAWRDHWIPPYLTRSIRSRRPYRASVFLPAAGERELPVLDLRFLEPGGDASLELRRGALRSIRGAVAAIKVLKSNDLERAEGELGSVELTGTGGEVELFLLADHRLLGTGGAPARLDPERSGEEDGLARYRFHLSAGETRCLEIHGSGP